MSSSSLVAAMVWYGLSLCLLGLLGFFGSSLNLRMMDGLGSSVMVVGIDGTVASVALSLDFCKMSSVSFDKLDDWSMDSLRFLSSCCAAMTGDNVLNVPLDSAMNTNSVIMMTS